MLCPSASVVLLSSIDWRRPTSLAPAVARTTLGPTPQTRYTTSTDMPVLGCSTRQRPVARSSNVEEATRGGGTVRSRRYAERVKLTVGDVVVYPAHGAGRVAARGRRVVLGAEQEVVVLELADGLSVTLPMQRARALLRPLVSEAGLRRVQETLREDGALSGDVWVKRLKQVQAKLRGGDPLELAEIVRDGARRERTLTANGTTSKLSISEKWLCVKARQRLSGEIGLARGLDRAEVDAWIDEQLAPIGS
jgi:CarD family transcriptional regulator